MAEFLTYYLFDRKRSNPFFYSDYDTIGRYINDALSDMRGLIKFNDLSICTYPGVVQQQRPVSQYVGEAIGLSVISRIHDLTKADWIPIKEGSENDIMNFKFPSGTEKKIIECQVSLGRFANMRLVLPESIQPKKTKNYVKFNLNGQIQYSSSGLVFGILPLPK